MSQNLLRKIILLCLLLILVIGFSVASPYFLTLNNFISLLQEASFMGLVAIGFTFVMIGGGLDLSIGAVTAVTGMICINFLHYTSTPVVLIVAAALAASFVFGFLNGLIITKFKLPDFIVTLSTKGILSGLALVIAVKVDGFVSNVFIENADYLWFAGKTGPVYRVTIAFAAMCIIAHILLKWTRFGVYVYATGANRKSAELSGINISGIRVGTYILSALCSAISAIFLSARMMTAMPEMGIGSELDTVAAVIIGGTAFRGGRGDILGTILGVMFLAILKNGILKLSIPTSLQSVIIGGIIMAAVIFDEWYRHHMEKRVQLKAA